LEAKSRRASAEAAFNTACQDSDRSPDQVSALIATDPAVCRQSRTRIQEIERAVNDADAAAVTRPKDLARSLEGLDETTDAEALTAIVATLATEIGDLHHQTGVLSAALIRDDNAHRTAADLSTEIDIARADLAIWQAVDDAVG
jgi:DNA repair protein SbcC/Rad50